MVLDGRAPLVQPSPGPRQSESPPRDDGGVLPSGDRVLLRSHSLASDVAALSRAEREVGMMHMTPQQWEALSWDWRFWGRPEQFSPAEDGPDGAWHTWIVIAGRGFGKTRSGAEWVREQVCGPTPLAPGRASRIALVGETAADVRDVMVRGKSGILSVHPPSHRPRYVESKRRLEWPNGAVALTFSAEEPDQLRGPEHDLAWCDELAKWRYADETWDMLQFGMRLGVPRQLVTTTPRPIPIVRSLLEQASRPRSGVVLTRGSTYDNRENLAPSFISKVRDRYEGTRLGRQELAAELLEDVAGALWTRDLVSSCTMTHGQVLPEMTRIVVAVDPSGTSGEEDGGDDIGIVVAGLGVDGLVYVLQDATCALGPSGWARRVVWCYENWRADCIVAESNYGGALVEHNVRTVRRDVSYRAVSATRGKVVRAEPVAALYEQGRVRHLGTFADLENQMCSMTRSEGYMGRGSPDRVDAMVWAVTDLVIRERGEGGVGLVRGGY